MHSRSGTRPAVVAVLFIVLSVWLATIDTSAQPSDAVMESLRSELSSGNASALAGMASGYIEIAIQGSNRQYSREQGSFVLARFFRENKPHSFRFVDFTKTGKGWFIEGRLLAGEARKPFRVYLRLSRPGSRWRLREILIEKVPSKH